MGNSFEYQGSYGSELFFWGVLFEGSDVFDYAPYPLHSLLFYFSKDFRKAALEGKLEDTVTGNNLQLKI